MENDKGRYVLPQDKKEELENELSELFKRQGLQDRSKGMARLFGIKVNQWAKQLEKEKPRKKKKKIETVLSAINPFCMQIHQSPSFIFCLLVR